MKTTGNLNLASHSPFHSSVCTPQPYTDLSVFCTDFKTKILMVYTKILKTEHQNEHNWSIIGKLLLKILKRL